MESRRLLRRLALAVALTAATIGFEFFGFGAAPPVVPTEPKHGLATAPRPGAPPCEAAAVAALPATVRELASSPLLDAFDPQHRDAVDQVLAEKRVFVVQCIVLEASRPEEWTGTATLRLLCRETNAANFVSAGDIMQVYHNPAAELKALHVDTRYEHLRPGEIRTFLLQRQWWKTFLRIPGEVTGTLDFVAMRDACDWPEARQFIGGEQYSVLDGTLALAKRLDRDPAAFEYSLLTIGRVHWSATDWRVGEVHRVAHFSEAMIAAMEEMEETQKKEEEGERVPLEGRIGAIPAHGVPLTVVVHHRGFFFHDWLENARVR